MEEQNCVRHSSLVSITLNNQGSKKSFIHSRFYHDLENVFNYNFAPGLRERFEVFEFPPGNLGVNSVPPEVEDGVLNDNGAVLWEKGLFYHFELNKGSLDKKFVQQTRYSRELAGKVSWDISFGK